MQSMDDRSTNSPKSEPDTDCQLPRCKTTALWHKIPPCARCKALSRRHRWQHYWDWIWDLSRPRSRLRANSDPNTDFPDYSLQVSFPDSGDEQDGEAATTGTKLFPVSQKTEDFLSSCSQQHCLTKTEDNGRLNRGSHAQLWQPAWMWTKSSCPDCLHRQRPRTSYWQWSKLCC